MPVKKSAIVQIANKRPVLSLIIPARGMSDADIASVKADAEEQGYALIVVKYNPNLPSPRLECLPR